MQLSDSLAQIVSAGAFAFYGMHCLLSEEARREFVRYRVPQFRVLVGLLELAGAAGIGAGFFLPWFTPLAAGGLALLMACGVAVRLRIGDSLPAIVPAFVLLWLNAFILLRSV